MNPRRFSGVVMLGGRSVRMGRDKAWLEVEGVPLWQRQRAMLQEAGAAELLFSLRPDQPSLGCPELEIRDRLADAGPIAGIQAVLGAAKNPWVALAAVDMPRLQPSWFQFLLEHCATDRGAVIRSVAYEPLAAIYPMAALEVIDSYIALGGRSLQGFVEELAESALMAVVSLPSSLAPQLENWNLPQDIAPSSS